MEHKVYIGLGGNLEDPHTHITQALQELDALIHCQLISVSPRYQSEAIGPPQPDYINAVACLHTTLTPLALLDALQAIEQSHRRLRLERWGPRTLDLDILLWDNNNIENERLTVPHPSLKARNFVVLPLFDIAPDLTLPCQTPLAQLAHKISRQGIQRSKEA
ncbi:MAG: 2-amino-4-hydroxy-6-hydroxymethyldihydropteridine diphosphokinase [Marinagarivorans sp.]|nr:2-amino-4-hydroxy-6-hydroxymethyldihydropteridine diphosphokinase [Marinagarivorans sp.]